MPTDKTPQLPSVEQLLTEMRERFASDPTTNVEFFLTRYPPLRNDREAVLDLIYNEILLHEERGQAPTLADWQRRFPEFADDLKAQFEVDALFQEDSLASHQGVSTQDLVPATNAHPANGISIPGYDILDVLGRGGMGVVYKARQKKLNRLVALKTLRSGLHASDDELVRFQNEAEAIARFQHPNLVQIFQVGSANGSLFLALEFVEGGTLAQQLNGTPWPATPAAQLCETLARAIDYAHEQGVIHRDLKPANVLLKRSAQPRVNAPHGSTKSEKSHSSTVIQMPSVEGSPPLHEAIPKITDFGLAKEVGNDQGHTESGAFLGTPSYAAPEQATGNSRSITPRTDVYALGAMLYELLTGRPPFRGTNLLETLDMVRHQEPVSPRQLNPKTPLDLETICLKCLRKVPAERYASARLLADDLQRFLNGQPILARPVGVVERSIKWLRRHPARAALFGVSLLALAAVTAALVSVYFNNQLALTATKEKNARQEADAQRTQAETARDEAETAKQEADRLRLLARRLQYNADMGAAQSAWKDGNVPRLLLLLKQHTPQPGNPDERGFEWYYLNGLSHREQSQFAAEYPLVFSPDGAYLATGVSQRSLPKETTRSTRPLVQLADARTGKQLRQFSSTPTYPFGAYDFLMAVAFSADGQTLVGIDTNNVAWHWDVATGKLLKQVNQQATRTNTTLGSIALSTDGTLAAAACADQVVRIWEPHTGKLVQSLPVGIYGNLSEGAFRPRSKQLFWGTDYRNDVWDVGTQKLLHTNQSQNGRFFARSFTPDGKYFLYSSSDGGIQLCFADDPKVIIRTFKGHDSGIRALAVSSNSRILATGSEDNLITLWDLTTGTKRWTYKGHQSVGGINRGIMSLGFRGEEPFLASLGSEGVVRYWDVRNHPDYRVVAVRDNGPSYQTGYHPPQLAYHPNGQMLAVASQLGKVTLAEPGKPPRTFQAEPGEITAIFFSPDGQSLITASTGTAIHRWDVATLRLQQTLSVNRQRGDGLAYSSKGTFFATLAADALELRHPLTWEVQRTIALPWKRPASGELAFSPDEKSVALGGHGALRIYELATGMLQRTIDRRGDPLISAAYSRDGQFLVTARQGFSGFSGSMDVWDATSGKHLHQLDGHLRSVAAMVCLPGKPRLLSSSEEDQTVRLWDLTTGREIMTLWENEAVLSLAVSPNGQHVACALRKNGEVRVLDATTSAKER